MRRTLIAALSLLIVLGLLMGSVRPVWAMDALVPEALPQDGLVPEALPQGMPVTDGQVLEEGDAVAGWALGESGPALGEGEPASFEMPEGAVYEPAVALVSVGGDTEAQDVASALAQAQEVPVDELGAEEVCEGVVRVELAPGTSVEDAINDLLATGVVEDAQPNYCYVAMDGEESLVDAPSLQAAGAAANDPMASDQWGLSSIRAQDAWSLAKANGAVTVAVLDLGCDVGHVDLAGNIVSPYNAYNAVHGGSTSDVTPVSVNGSHGTHVAGIVGAVANNGVGVSGVSHNARIMPIKVVDPAGNAYTQSLVAAYDYVLKNAASLNVRVINLSMGAAGPLTSDDAFLRKIDEAYAKGIVTVSCAGNRSAQGSYGFPYDCYPGDYDKVVSVINLTQAGSGVEKSDQSNYNKGSERDKNISAPGTSILSTTPHNDYGRMSGTSMAVPHVSGTLALMFAANPKLTAAEAVDMLYRTATDIGAAGWDATYGWGEVNAYEAVRAAKAAAPQVSATWKRLEGAGRYDTMAAIVSEGFSASTWAVVATGSNFPDALAASALAGTRGCPVILTDGNALSSQAQSQLKRLGVKNVYLMGGTGAVSASVETSIKSLGIAVRRVSGASRQATSVEAMRAAREGGSTSSTLVVATGIGFADALSIGPWSWSTKSPVVLTGSDGLLSAEEVAAIQADGGFRQVVLVGGTGVVDDGVKSQLGGGYSYVRLEGANRYATSKAIAEWEMGQGLGWTYPAVATGSTFPDALAGSALCGAKRSVLVLAAGSGDPTVSLVKSHVAQAKRGYLLGGQSALPDALAAALG